MKTKQMILVMCVVSLLFSGIADAAVCLGCVSGTYTGVSTTNQTNSTNLTITVNASVLTSSTMSIVDAKVNTSGIYGSVDTTGLVGWWRMDEVTGIYANDSSGLNNNGTWQGNNAQNYTTGKYNSGGNFSPSNLSFVNVGSNESLNITGSITIEAWIKPDDIASSHHRIYGTSTTYSKNTMLYLRNTGTITWGVNNGTHEIIIVVAPVITTSTWYHIAATWDGAITQYVYINAVPYTAVQGPTANIRQYTGGTIGASDTFVPQFNGSIDDVRIYNRSLSAEEIRQSYLVGVQQLQAKYNTNSTYSSNLNGTSSVSVPYLFGESYSALQWLVPDNITDATGVSCYNCSQQMQFKPTLNLTGTENATMVTTQLSPALAQITYTWVPANLYDSSIHVIPGLPAGVSVNIALNGTTVGTFNVNSTGHLVFSSTGGSYSHIYTITGTDIVAPGYVESQCRSIGNWGTTGVLMILVLILAMVGAIAVSALQGKGGSIDNIIMIVQILGSMVVILAIVIFITDSIFVIIEC